MDFDQAVSFNFLLYESPTDLTARKPPPSTPSSSVSQTEQQQRAARGLHLGTIQSKAVASPSRTESPAVGGEVTARGSLKGKRKAVEQAEKLEVREDGEMGKSRAIEVGVGREARGERRAWQAAESHGGEGERAAATTRHIGPVMSVKYHARKEVEPG